MRSSWRELRREWEGDIQDVQEEGVEGAERDAVFPDAHAAFRGERVLGFKGACFGGCGEVLESE